MSSKNKKPSQSELADKSGISSDVIDNYQYGGFVPTSENELIYHFNEIQKDCRIRKIIKLIL